jgi:tetratricopeptide (TPR) repeat protein
LGEFAAAEAALRQSLAMDPRRPQAMNDLAAVLFALGRDAEALTYIRQALELDPDMPEAEESESIWLLRYGRFRDGWRRYEARLRAAHNKPHTRDFEQPQWTGGPLDGRTILLHAEQGYGDAIQFARYAPLVAARGARVVMAMYDGLMPLFRNMPGVLAVGENERLPPFDLHCPLVSLPYAFDTDLDSIPAAVPYVAPDAEHVWRWRARLGARTGPRVGVAWSGNPAHRDDLKRSIPLAMFRRIVEANPGVEFHVLQTEIRESDRPALARLPNLRDHSGLLADFAETAALVSLMDTIVSVDTSLVHLAGAMGWPVWALLASVADWRWMVERDDGPWYPTAWLFRQRRRGEWDPVLADVAARLREMLG